MNSTSSKVRARTDVRRQAWLGATLSWFLIACTMAGLGMRAGTAPAFAGPASVLPEDEEAAPLCWSGYLTFESLHGLDGIRDAVRRAIAYGDLDALAFLRERLTEIIGSDAAQAVQVIAWAEEADGPELFLYLQGVRQADAVHTPLVSGRLLEMAEWHPDPYHQAQALVALETQRRLEPAALDQLTRLAWGGSVTGVSMHAVRTMGRVMATDYQEGNGVEPYMGRLLDVAEGMHEAEVRRLAIEMATYPDPRFAEGETNRLAQILRNDPDPTVREMAALVMSSAQDVDAVLAHFQSAFTAEAELCVRWAIFRYSVRTGGPASLPLLQEMAGIDPRLEQDYVDFVSLYDTGIVDFERIWLRKETRHSCEFEH